MSVRAPAAGVQPPEPQCRVSIGAPVQANRRLDEVLAVGFAKLQIKPCAETSMQEPSSERPGPSSERPEFDINFDDADLADFLDGDQAASDVDDDVDDGVDVDALADIADDEQVADVMSATKWSERQQAILQKLFDAHYLADDRKEKIRIKDVVVEAVLAKINDTRDSETEMTKKELKKWLQSKRRILRNPRDIFQYNNHFSKAQIDILTARYMSYFANKPPNTPPVSISGEEWADIINEVNQHGKKQADQTAIRTWWGRLRKNRGNASDVPMLPTARKDERIPKQQVEILKQFSNRVIKIDGRIKIPKLVEAELLQRLNTPDQKPVSRSLMLKWFNQKGHHLDPNNTSNDQASMLQALIVRFEIAHDDFQQTFYATKENPRIKQVGDMLEEVFQDYKDNRNIEFETIREEVLNRLNQDSPVITSRQLTEQNVAKWYQKRRIVYDLEEQLKHYGVSVVRL